MVFQYKHEYNIFNNCVSGWRLCKSSYLRRVHNFVDNTSGVQYEECRITAREDDDFVCSYLGFSAQSFSHYQHCSGLCPLKVKRDRVLSNYTIV
jgi:hypothetical protein